LAAEPLILSTRKRKLQLPKSSVPDRLTQPVRVTHQVWPDGATPVVSIICITYNHVRFVAECLDSFLMQETTFPIEIVVQDDASTDGTPDIIREYHARFPKLIRPVLREKNQYTTAGAMIAGLLGLVKGEYYALCEGDDFWTYSGKLQEQVRLLDENPHLVMVSHGVQSVSESGEPLPRSGRLTEGEAVEYSDKDVLRSVFNHPNTWVARKSADLSDAYPLFLALPMGDDPWSLALLQKGRKGLSLGKVWSAYRHHGGGAWSTLSRIHRSCQELVLFVSQRKYYGPRYGKEYDALVSRQRTVLGQMVSNAVTQGNARQAARDLRYCRSYRSPFFPASREIALIVAIAFGDLVLRVSRGLVRRAGRAMRSMFAAL